MFDAETDSAATASGAPPSTPSKTQQPRQPNRLKAIVEDDINANSPRSPVGDSSVLHFGQPVSPTKRNNKENDPPRTNAENMRTGRLTKNQMIAEGKVVRTRHYDPARPLTAEETAKLATPKVKRLANVAQLCK